MTEKEQQSIFKNWISQYKGLIFKVVRSYSFNAMDHDDLFQEIAVQIWHSILSFRHECSVTSWLYRISLNTAIKWTAKENKPYHEDVDSQHILQDTGIQIDERLEWLYDEISRFNKIDRSIILLMLDGFSYKEIATIAGITESNVGVKINRLKKQLITQSKKYNHHGI